MTNWSGKLNFIINTYKVLKTLQENKKPLFTPKALAPIVMEILLCRSSAQKDWNGLLRQFALQARVWD